MVASNKATGLLYNYLVPTVHDKVLILYIVFCVGGSKQCHISYCPYSTNQLHNCTVRVIQYSCAEDLFKECYVYNIL